MQFDTIKLVVVAIIFHEGSDFKFRLPLLASFTGSESDPINVLRFIKFNDSLLSSHFIVEAGSGL